MNTFVTKIDVTRAEELRSGLLEQGFSFSTPQHTLFSAKKTTLTCTLYSSGSLVVQGKGMKEFLEFYLEPNFLHELPYTSAKTEGGTEIDLTEHMGADESGKGDLFGPLCTAAVFADEKKIHALLSLGVADSKSLRDAKIAYLAPRIQTLCPHSIVVLPPQRYNALYTSFHNLNTLLAWAHATTLEQLHATTGCRRALVDQFANERVLLHALAKKKLSLELQQRPRAEEDPVVAAASILARHAFVQELTALSKQYAILLPKGAAPQTIRAGREFIAHHGEEALPHVAKMHFKTIDAIMRPRSPWRE